MKRIGTRGITLLELLVVILIMAVTAGFASLSADMIRRGRVASATRELYADLQKARLDAITLEGKGFGIRLESPNSYVIFKFDDCNDDYSYDPSACGGVREETEIVKRNVHPSVALQKTNPYTAVNNDVRIFDRFGTPRNINWAMGNLTILVKNVRDTGLIKCVSVSTNRIREAVWNGSECSEQ